MNEKELEIIRKIRDKLENKKHLTDYEKGQMDLIKRLRRKKPPTKFERALPIIAICVISFAMLVLFYAIYKNIHDGSFAIESAAKKWVKGFDNQEYCCSTVIDEKNAVAFINFDCTPINRITKGIQNCNGRYYIFLNKIDNKWIVNESSKTIIWER